MFFIFNTGQLSAEKTKLVNTADAVAYSAAVMHARALNFDAYNNRALVANEVLVAQMVSLSSWSQYADTHAQNLISVFPECANPYSAAVAALINYDPLYGLSCYATVTYASTEISYIAGLVPTIAQGIVQAIEWNKTAIRAAENWVHAPTVFEKARSDVMNEVAQRNYAGDGAVTVVPAGASPSASSLAMTDNWSSFTQQYSGDDRVRFAEVAKLAAYSDKFVEQRSWDSTAFLPNLPEWKCALRGQKNSVKRRGGTELVGLDEWKAEDTESFWQGHNAGRFWQIRCNEDENPIAWGEQKANQPGGAQSEAGLYLGGSPGTNPLASSNASSAEWNDYTGLPSFYDLSTNMLSDPDPRLKFAVIVVRNSADAKTSGAASPIGASEHLNNFSNSFAQSKMSAMATAEAYFERPYTDPTDPTKGAFNQYAEKNNNPNKRELGSLFNPYWQARLVPNSATDIAAQQALLGAVTP